MRARRDIQNPKNSHKLSSIDGECNRSFVYDKIQEHSCNTASFRFLGESVCCTRATRLGASHQHESLLFILGRLRTGTTLSYKSTFAYSAGPRAMTSAIIGSSRITMTLSIRTLHRDLALSGQV